MAIEIEKLLEKVKRNKGLTHNDDDEMLKGHIWGICQRFRGHGVTDDVITSEAGAIAITLLLDIVRSGISIEESPAFTHWIWMLHNISQNLTEEQRAKHLGEIS